MMGYNDEALTLFGFGIDSFIEVLSGIGIAHMIMRIRKHENGAFDHFERTALRITGTAFFLLTGGLLSSSIYTLLTNHKPETTLWGIIISLLSLLTMGFLYWGKNTVGQRLDSRPIIADAKCTLVCIWMSGILLASSALYELFSLGWFDSLGLAGLAYFAAREGRECFQKAKHQSFYCCSENH